MRRSSERPLSMTVRSFTPPRMSCRKTATGAGAPTAMVMPFCTQLAASTSSMIRCRRSAVSTVQPFSRDIYAPKPEFCNGRKQKGKKAQKEKGERRKEKKEERRKGEREIPRELPYTFLLTPFALLLAPFSSLLAPFSLHLSPL